MAQAIDRKQFLALTISLTALGAAAACGDDDDSSAGNAGSGGGGAGGSHTGGTPNSGGSSAGKGGNVNGGNGNQGGNGGSANGGSGGSTNGGNGGTKAQGGETSGGAAGSDAGAGGSGEGGMPEGGAAGSGGAGGEGGGPAALMCQGATLTQTATTGAGHDHIPDDPAAFFATFTAHVNADDATSAIALPQDAGHSHNITLTDDQVSKLRAGLVVTGVVSSTTGHTHTYTISCA